MASFTHRFRQFGWMMDWTPPACRDRCLCCCRKHAASGGGDQRRSDMRERRVFFQMLHAAPPPSCSLPIFLQNRESVEKEVSWLRGVKGGFVYMLGWGGVSSESSPAAARCDTFSRDCSGFRSTPWSASSRVLRIVCRLRSVRRTPHRNPGVGACRSQTSAPRLLFWRDCEWKN